MRSFAALLAAALATGADAHAGLMNPHPRGPYSDPRYSTFLASSFAEQGLTAPEFLQLCPNSFAGEATATYRPGQLINVTYEVTGAHDATPGVRLALRYPGTEFGANVLVDDDGSGAFVDQTTEDGRAITTQGVHTVTVKLPDTLTCDGVAPADLCQLQWVLASDLAHEGGAYSLGCADVRISTTAHVDHGYGPAPPGPAPTFSGNPLTGVTITSVEGAEECKDHNNPFSCEYWTETRTLRGHCVWMEDYGNFGECVDGGFKWKTIFAMLIVAGVLLFLTFSYAAKRHRDVMKDKIAKTIKTAKVLSAEDQVHTDQLELGPPAQEEHHSERALVARAPPPLPPAQP